MKKIGILLIGIIVLSIVTILIFRNSGNRTTTFNSLKTNQTSTATPMTITSPAFLDNEAIPKQYSCDGDGVNPPLEFKNVPENAKSLALIVEDPDAPVGTWYHWIMWNIPASVTGIAQNSVPAGAVQGKGSSGQNVYGAPCPPSGIHHYIFTVYALDSNISLPSYSTAENLQSAMQGHIKDKARLIGLYGR